MLWALGAIYLIWGATFLAMRVAMHSFPPLMMSGLRYLLTGTTMYLFLRTRGAPAPTVAQWAASTWVAMLMLVIGNGAVALAEQMVAFSLCAILLASIPLFAALFAGFWGRWPHAREWMGPLLGLVGNLEGNLRANPTGAALVLLASAATATGSTRRPPWSPWVPCSTSSCSARSWATAPTAIPCATSGPRSPRAMRTSTRWSHCC